MKIAAILPARDEAASVAAVVAGCRRALPEMRVIVVDDGSSDATATVAAAAGAEVVRAPRSGYGHAVRAGTDAAAGAAVYVYLDADGSMPPEEIPRLLEPLLGGRADIVLGRRLDGAAAGMPWHQRLGNRVIARLLRHHGVTVHELGPFRAARAEVVDALSLPGSRYAWPAQMLTRAARAGARIVEVPVGSRPRSGGRSKVGGSLRGSLAATRDIAGVLLRSHP